MISKKSDNAQSARVKIPAEQLDMLKLIKSKCEYGDVAELAKLAKLSEAAVGSYLNGSPITRKTTRRVIEAGLKLFPELKNKN